MKRYIYIDYKQKEEDSKLMNVKQGVTKQNLFTYVSLFSGIGGFEQALNKLGGKCVFASEIDKHAAKAYEAIYGYKPAGDITQIDAKDIPDHDLLVGGFPCQAFSVAGKRRGFEDTRGTLFFEIARIAKEKQPKAMLLENVKGLVNHDKGRTLDVMIEILNEIGYVVDFDVLNSKYFGVPQNRERIFIVAIRDDLIEQEKWPEETTKGNTIVSKRRRHINKWAKTFNFDFPKQNRVTVRLRDILEPEVDEKYYIDEKRATKLIAQLEEATDRCIKNSDAKVQCVGNINPSGQGISGAVYDVEAGLSPTLVASSETKILINQGVITPKYRIRKLTPLECWRLQGFPDEAHEAAKRADIPDSQRYKQAGNAVTVNVVEAIAERLIPLIADI